MESSSSGGVYELNCSKRRALQPLKAYSGMEAAPFQNDTELNSIFSRFEQYANAVASMEPSVPTNVTEVIPAQLSNAPCAI